MMYNIRIKFKSQMKVLTFHYERATKSLKIVKLEKNLKNFCQNCQFVLYKYLHNSFMRFFIPFIGLLDRKKRPGNFPAVHERFATVETD